MFVIMYKKIPLLDKQDNDHVITGYCSIVKYAVIYLSVTDRKSVV